MDSALLRRLRTLARSAQTIRDKEGLCAYVAGASPTWNANHALSASAGELRWRLQELDVDTRHYAASTLLALALGESRRKRLAAFFTPPFIVRHAIDSAIQAGLDLKCHRVIDPAAGGAAFLSPLAGRMRSADCPTEDISNRLVGVELDPNLARLANHLIDSRLGSTGGAFVQCHNALLLADDSFTATFDAVLANPPYGRLTGKAARRLGHFAELVNPGHVNNYALFAGLASRLVKEGGVVVLVIPASFLAGPLFAPLRAHFRRHYRVESVDLIAERNGTFLDVQQDTCVLTMRRGPTPQVHGDHRPRFAMLSASGVSTALGSEPSPSSETDPWKVPNPSGHLDSGTPTATLADYGVEVRAGYFVWNREKERMTATPTGTVSVPLIWASNIRPGKRCYPASRYGEGIDYVSFTSDSPAIVRDAAIALQRTTNNRQPRRIVAAFVPGSVARQYGGFVSENHTLLLLRSRADADLDLVWKLLNTAAVDQRLRRLLSGAHVSVCALRALDLPLPSRFAALLDKSQDPETAALFAYQTPTLPRSDNSAATRAVAP